MTGADKEQKEVPASGALFAKVSAVGTPRNGAAYSGGPTVEGVISDWSKVS
jgi:hypothetical protein